MNHSTAQYIGALRFVRYDNLVLFAVPWLPLLSGTLVSRMLGTAALAVVCATLLLALQHRNGRSDTRGGAIAILALMLIGLVSTRSVQVQTLVQVVQLLVIALAIRVGPMLRFTRRAIGVCAVSCMLLAVAALIDLDADGSLMFDNANTYGVAAMCWFAVLVKLLPPPNTRARLIRFIVWLAVPIAITILSESRASLAAITVIVVWPVARKILPGARTRMLAELLVLALPVLLIALVATGALSDVQNLIPLVGDKSPFSGRNVIWTDVVSALDANGYQGFGLGSLPGPLLEAPYTGLSAHNGFLQIFYQFGAVGLAVFLTACGWVIATVSRRDDRGISVAILLGALIHEMFEVALTQNHFGPGLLLWLIVTMAPVASRRTTAWFGLHRA